MLRLLATGIAPGSFYAGGTGDGRGHFDALPVDFTARAVTVLGDGAREGYWTYNVVNPHEDGISLDTGIGWLIAAGHPLTRVHGHTEWTERFETALRGLPDRRRQHSLLPLLHAFAEPAPPLAGSALSTDRFRAAVRAAALDEESDIPSVTGPDYQVHGRPPGAPPGMTPPPADAAHASCPPSAPSPPFG
ncbi:hypothetical protein [Kitasatospora sp. NPDC127116]|uniref:hypothetical protein n=1 Tax=unclassified Kitasatospora TaxID=2633591 RepID=UPI00336F1E25